MSVSDKNPNQIPVELSGHASVWRRAVALQVERIYAPIDAGVAATASGGGRHDLGRSGADATAREGFKNLVPDVGAGKLGMILGIEVSRFTRQQCGLVSDA
jgi:hypothetical protein